MDLGIKNKNALITGGSRGLGLASAVSLAKEGVNLIICARSKDDLEKAKDKLDQYNVNVITFEQELSDEKSVKEFYSKIKSKVNNVDILVNNVGGSLGTTSLLESEIKDFQKVMDINTWVAISLTKLFVEEMID